MFPLISHELLDALAFGGRVVLAVTFQKVDAAPHAQAAAQGDDQSLQNVPELKATRAKLHAYLAPYAPPTPCSGPVRLLVKWLFPTDGRHNDGEWRTTKPDTDNLEKALKDEMTRLHFWRDDAFVCSEVVEKFWADTPGIFIKVVEL